MAYSKYKHFVIYKLYLSQEEIQQGTPTYPPEWLRLKRIKILTVGNYIKQVDLSYIDDGNVNGTTAWEITYKVKHILTI